MSARRREKVRRQRKEVGVLVKVSRDLHRPEGPDEARMEKRDHLLADLLTAAWPSERSQRQ